MDMITCPVCGKTSFTEININTHVEYCLQKSQRQQQEEGHDDDKKRERHQQHEEDERKRGHEDVSSNIIKKKKTYHSSTSKKSPLALPRRRSHNDNIVKYRLATDMNLSTSLIQGDLDRRHDSQSDKNIEEEIPSVYDKITLEDLETITIPSRNNKLKSTCDFTSCGFLPSFTIQRLLNKLKSEIYPSIEGECSSVSNNKSPCGRSSSEILALVNPSLRLNYSTLGVVLPEPDAIPDKCFCLSSDISDNKVYLAFWEGDKTCVNSVYTNILDDIIKEQFCPSKYDINLPYQTPFLSEIFCAKRNSGYDTVTMEDLNDIVDPRGEKLKASTHEPKPEAELDPVPLPKQQLQQRQPYPQRRVYQEDQQVDTGHAVCIRQGGATVRDDINIDSSNECPYRQQHQETFYFTKIEMLPPPDEECVPVFRLFGYLIRDGGRCYGWTSLTGRTIEDKKPILRITKTPVWLKSHPLRDHIISTSTLSSRTLSAEHALSSTTHVSSTLASGVTTPQLSGGVLKTANCPMCNMLFSADMSLIARQSHVNQCLMDIEGDFFSQPT